MSNNGGKAGMGFFEVLQLVFIVLKLCKVIKWSWVWVLSPTWITLGVAAILLVVVLILELLKKGLKK